MSEQNCINRYFAVALLALLTGAAFAVNSTATEEHIRRVQWGIVPRVLVNDEAPRHAVARCADKGAQRSGCAIAIAR
jgi:hypothetical protein